MNKYSDESNNSNHGHPSHLDAQVCLSFREKIIYNSEFYKNVLLELSDANAHEVVQSPTKFLHLRIRSLSLLVSALSKNS